MLKYFSKSSIGFSHIQSGKCCQDYSASYHDETRTIVTACDGHGGDLYIRSDQGSAFASNALINVFQRINKNAFYKHTKETFAQKIGLEILCEWNALVERSLSCDPIRKRDVANLSEDKIFRLKMDPAKAYGTTLNGAMVMGNKLVCASIGDGGVFLVRKGKIFPAFDEDEQLVANITASLCQDDAYKYIKVAVFNFNELDGVFCVTDGLINPYSNLTNFNNSFVKPIVLNVLGGQTGTIDDFVSKVGSKLGLGDDVSLSFIFKDNATKRFYLL